MKIGIEIHQQLDTKKLFCPCESRIREQPPDHRIQRKQRAVLSEMGQLDPAARAEMKRDRTFTYEGYSDLCLVELDEEPPHPMDREALEIGLQVALLLNARPVEEIHVMRKTVVDGSNTSGFQRTSLIATDGYIETKEGKIGIPSICLEEDAARIIGVKDVEAVYRLDRLGIPLIEIATSPDMKTPEQAMEVAGAIGNVLRSVKIKRGLGTIRQDLNVSIPGSERTEIKGVQKLESIPEIIANEGKRQGSLLEIKEELRERKATVEGKIEDMAKAFEQTDSKMAGKLLKQGAIYGARLKGFAGLLKKEVNENRRFGTELSEYAKARGAGGLFHSDELPNYGIGEAEVERVKKRLGTGKEDAFILVGGPKDKAKKALKDAIERAQTAIERVPGETRKALEDGTSQYMRPIPGAARMYPETDIPPIKAFKVKKPELIDARIERLSKGHNIPRESVKELLDTGRLQAFENAVKIGVNRTLASVTLTEQMSALSREGLEIDKITDRDIEELFKAFAKGRFAKEAIPEMLKSLYKGKSLDEAVKEGGLEKKIDLGTIVAKVFAEKPGLVEQKAFKPLMGIVMQKTRGRIDGKKVAEEVKKRLEK